MTIRVNKQPFNIREKLSELERPIGVKGSELMKSETVYQARNALSADRKNLVINGNMAIDQRNDGSSFTATDHYVLDRYKLKENTSGSFSINRDAFPVGDQHPEGHRYAMQIACSGADTSLSSNEHGVIFQFIEGFNTIGTGFGTKAAKNMTLSFWVKTNVPGTYSIALQNGAQNRSQVKEYQAGMSGMVWEKISVTFSGCNDGTWVVSTAAGMKITWGLAGAQSTYATTDIDAWKSSNLFLSADQVNFFSSKNNRFFLTGVQLEIGDQDTEFEHRSYGEELALCQRYYQKVPSNTSSPNYIYDHSVFHYGSSFYASHTFMQPMRESPSVSITTNGSYYEAGSAYTHGSITVRNITREALNFHATTGGGTNGYAGGVYFSYTADAEL